jgi:glycosyltransferase involved in cell wall biosynthesis
MPPKVAVITPTKNRLKLLCEAIDSVRAQTFEAWEHIIVDDGSCDGTAEEVRRRAESDPRIRYIERTGSKAGANVCRNLGIRESPCDLIVFLDSDDLLRPGCLEMRVGIMNRNADLDFAVFRAGIFIQSIGDFPRLYHEQDRGDDLLRFLSHECVWEISGPVWRRAFLEKVGCFDEMLLSMQDLEMHVRAICAGGKYIFLREIDHDIRGNSDPTRTSTRHFGEPAYIEAAERVGDSLFNSVKNAGLLTWSRQRALLGLSFGHSQCWLSVGSADRAIKTWNEGCSRHGGPLHVRLLGLGMLQLLRLGCSDAGLISRMVNKWKGWNRFRQEPKLMVAADAFVTQTSHLAGFES